MAKGKYRGKREHAANAPATPETLQNPETQQTQATTWAYDADLLEHKEGAARLADLDFEEQAARNAAGMEEQVYGIWGPIWKLMNWLDRFKKEHTVKKSTYLWLILFTGWFGGHRYYEKRYILGVLYTVFFWTGVPLAMAILDAIAVIPLKSDENGMVLLNKRPERRPLTPQPPAAPAPADDQPPAPGK